MSNLIFVIDTNKNSLTPCKPSMARKLLIAGKAAIFRMYPFTIILKKFVKGFQTGDIVKAIVTFGKKIGTYVGRVAVRTSGYFNISASELVSGISHKYCKIVHHKDGYSYAF